MGIAVGILLVLVVSFALLLDWAHKKETKEKNDRIKVYHDFVEKSSKEEISQARDKMKKKIEKHKKEGSSDIELSELYHVLTILDDALIEKS